MDQSFDIWISHWTREQIAWHKCDGCNRPCSHNRPDFVSLHAFTLRIWWVRRPSYQKIGFTSSQDSEEMVISMGLVLYFDCSYACINEPSINANTTQTHIHRKRERRGGGGERKGKAESARAFVCERVKRDRDRQTDKDRQRQTKT